MSSYAKTYHQHAKDAFIDPNSKNPVDHSLGILETSSEEDKKGVDIQGKVRGAEWVAKSFCAFSRCTTLHAYSVGLPTQVPSKP